VSIPSLKLLRIGYFLAISNSTIGECCSRLWLRCKGAYSFENFIFACAIQIIRESFHFVDGRLRWLALAQPWLQFIVEEILIKLSQLAVVAASSSLCAVLLRVLRCREATRHYCDISLSAIYAAIVYVYFGLCGEQVSVHSIWSFIFALPSLHRRFSLDEAIVAELYLLLQVLSLISMLPVTSKLSGIALHVRCSNFKAVVC
jgi:hypothetical protein